MILMNILKSIFEIVEELNESNNPKEVFPIYMGDFLDYVYSADKQIQAEAIRQEPIMYSGLPMMYYAYLSATADTIAHKYGIEIAEAWFNRRKYILEEPHFPHGLKGDIQIILIAESPIEFRARNIFVSSNALSRV